MRREPSAARSCLSAPAGGACARSSLPLPPPPPCPARERSVQPARLPAFTCLYLPPPPPSIFAQPGSSPAAFPRERLCSGAPAAPGDVAGASHGSLLSHPGRR
ncbi:unnamed protein product [Caretta caretta]